MVSNLSLERQMGQLHQIDPSHKERYYFAREHINKGDRVLDAACGCGYGSQILSKDAWVTGIDISEKAIEYAQINYPIPRYILGDVLDIKWKFDVIVSFETIEHLEKYERLLSKFSEHGKKLICSVPNEELYPFNPEDFKEDKYPHVRHFTPDEFRELLDVTGWKVLSEYCNDKYNPKVREGTDGKFMVFICESKFLSDA